MSADTLRAQLDHDPVPLKFGTSGRRGLLIHLTQLEVYINALAELEYLQSLPTSEGGIKRGDEFYFGYDLRPSSRFRIPELNGGGELDQAIERAIRDAGMEPVNLGRLPTPALAFHALARQRGSMMVTGSHIPAEYNGYKTNSSIGELRKPDELPITLLAEQVRTRLYDQPADQSLFDAQGHFKSARADLPAEVTDAREGYFRRYADFFAGKSLEGKRILVYQHSAVGRDLLVEMLEHFGAEAIPVGRCEDFVPIDTENVEPEQLARIQSLVDDAWATHGPLDAVVSTDGDSDRPMLFGLEAPAVGAKDNPPGRVRFFSGDLVGMIVAEFLPADAVVVPITCNDAIDRSPLKNILEPKTRIGSPYVIEGMEAACARGRMAVCGWEANGGFLTGSDIRKGDRLLHALPTRDAMLPILSVLFRAADQGLSLCELFDRLPKRFSRAALLKNFPRPVALKMVRELSPLADEVAEIRFQTGGAVFLDRQRAEVASSDQWVSAAMEVRASLEGFFTRELGFGDISRLDYTDGVRIYFDNGDIAHVRPSGNADELRIYAVADTLARAEAIVQAGIAEPGGILRQLEESLREKS
ncbi:MAG: phosphomannomutase [Verrucomicrobia bacterium]|nr:phosphomannomutase [Verrucomicrobiota bacterium]